MMDGQTKLVCVEAALGITEGQEFPVLGDNGSAWEILLGGEYRKVNKWSGRVQGWKSGPRFGYKTQPTFPRTSGRVPA